MSEWISVKDRMPPDGEMVLIFLPEENRGLPGCEVAMWLSSDTDPAGRGGCWWTNGGPNAGNDIEDWFDATHWRPLPPFPTTAPDIQGECAPLGECYGSASVCIVCGVQITRNDRLIKRACPNLNLRDSPCALRNYLPEPPK